MNYYNEIKNKLIGNEINKKVKSYSINKSDLKTYYNVGKILSEAGKHYGENIIKQYSEKLKIEIGKKYNSTLERLNDLELKILEQQIRLNKMDKKLFKEKEINKQKIKKIEKNK